MTRKLQILRGTTAQNNAYTGAVGELTMDTDRNEVRIHDGQTVGGIKISDRNMPILTSMFFDHITNNMSWLRADTFSWQSGDVYKAAYEHLVDDVGEVWYAWTEIGGGYCYTKTPTVSVGDTVYSYDFSVYGQVSAVLSDVRFNIGPELFHRSAENDIPAHKTDTIGDISITYYLADDGHKICLPDQESNIAALYEATGVAWYFILDTTNKQFKLPREDKDGKYLYFYVGNFEQSAIEQTAGITAETLNGKVDLPTGKAQSDVDFVVESQLPTSENGYTWYRKYKSGWVEQGGLATIPERTNMGSSYTDISLPVIMADANYTPMISITTGGAYWASAQVSAREPSTTTIKLIAYWNTASGTFVALPVAWTVSGMSAQ